MTNLHDEIVAGVLGQLKASEEAAARERKRREAVSDFWQRTTNALEASCTPINRLLGKQMFTAMLVEQDNNYVCFLMYKGPTERLAGVLLDGKFWEIEITIPHAGLEVHTPTG